jgi:hypothetical protein
MRHWWRLGASGSAHRSAAGTSASSPGRWSPSHLPGPTKSRPVDSSPARIMSWTLAPVAARSCSASPLPCPDDFSVDRHADVLLGLHHSSAELRFTHRRFIVTARA